LLAERYPCIICQDNEQIENYKVRLIICGNLLNMNDLSSDSNLMSKFELDECRTVFIAFKAWCHIKLSRTFTSLEVHFIFRHLALSLDGQKLSLANILKKFVELDPINGVVMPQFD
jgi:hypothetical protein